MKLVYGYQRVSGHGQIDGDGFHRQREEIERFFKTYFSTEDCLEFGREAGVSGTKDVEERILFAQCLGDWQDEENRPYAVIVERLDRFARDLMVQECALRDLKRLGIKVFSCDHGLVDMADDTTDPTRTLIRQVFGAIAQYDKSITVKKLAVARQRIKAAGGKCEGRKYFGEFDEIEKVARLRIITLRQGNLNFRLIAAVLWEEGIRNRYGRPVSRHTCRRVWRRFEKFINSNEDK
jgi:DNA invertase Pin-like site-specific DNA recombinase